MPKLTDRQKVIIDEIAQELSDYLDDTEEEPDGDD